MEFHSKWGICNKKNTIFDCLSVLCGITLTFNEIHYKRYTAPHAGSSHLNNSISQDFKVSFFHQDVTFHMMRIFTEGLWIKKVHCNSDKWKKSECQTFKILKLSIINIQAVFSVCLYRWAPGGSSSLMFSSEIVPQLTFSLSEICSVLLL